MLFGQRVGLSLDWALLLGALFLAHPIHTESAAWSCRSGKRIHFCFGRYGSDSHLCAEVLYIVGRADLLCLLLVLLAALVYAPCIKATLLSSQIRLVQ